MKKVTRLVRLSFIGLFLLVASVVETNAQCGCNFTIPAGTGTFVFDGNIQGVQPGHVICLAAGARERIIFHNLNGSPANYVKIMNCGGKAELGGPNASNAITINRSRYFHVTGTGDPSIEYGIKIVESKANTQGIAAQDRSSDMTFDHLEITRVGFAGIMAKTDPKNICTDTSNERPNFTMYNVEIFHNYVHDIGGEGLYIGNSFYTGTTVYCGSMQYCHEVRNVRIYDNLFENTGWESIQVGATVENCEIFNNRIYNYGVANLPAQNGGIQVGLSVGRVYNNFIKKGTGIAIMLSGIGADYAYNNVVIEAGTAAVLITTRPTPLPTDIVPNGFVGGVYVMNNTFINSTGDIVKQSVGGTPGNVLANNLVVGGKSNWYLLLMSSPWLVTNNLYLPNIADAKFVNPALDDYRLLSGSPAINAGIDLSVHGYTSDFDNNARPPAANWDLGAFELSGNQSPVVTVGANQTLTLPTVTTSISGSASDADGTIASYLWTKQTGPTVTITNATTTTVSLADLVPGIYVFRLTATDNLGGTGFKDVTVTVVDPTVNQPPVASGGGNKTITLPVSSVILNGSGSDADGTIVSYAWTKISALAATMVNQNTATLTVNGMVQGVHTFRLTVTDDDGDTDTEDVTVTVQAAAANQNPSSNAGADKNLVLPTNSVNLVGSGSDPDGSITAYTWTKDSGGAATMTNANTSTLQLTGLVQGTYVFRLTVTDNQSATAFDLVTVVVSAANQAPQAEAGANKTIQLPTSATTLPGSGSDIDGSITAYAWTKVSGPAVVLSNITTPTLSLSGLVQGTYVFRLTVTDNGTATGSDEVTLTVQALNVAPTADAGPLKTLILPANAVALVGSGIDPDGTIASYLWEKMSGPAATLVNANQATLNLSNLVEGAYSFRLTVTDNLGATGTSTVSVVVFPNSTNQSPVVDAGAPVTLTLPANSASLTGIASDADGSISSFLWEKVIGPGATLSGTSTASLALTNLVEGSYLFRLTVTDDDGASASDDISVVVTSTNQPPLVDAGSNLVVVLPTSTTDITAIASDPDGSVASYLWASISALGPVSMTGTTTSTLTLSNLAAGVYIFRLTVTDNQGSTAFDDVNVTVQSATNVNPVADAGPQQVVFLPTNSVNLSGSGSDADGTISTFAWTKASGPAATLTNSSSPTVSISDLVSGNYIFRLTVTDDDGATGIDDVIVTVNPASANETPVADAGPNIALTLPINSTNLIGSGSDADGTISSYVWAKISGPAATLANANTPVLSVQDLTEGIYFFRLTIIDNVGATSSDDTQVTVLPSTVNQAPMVSAGNDQTITLPNNALNLSALASDPDGTIASYSWVKQIGPTVTFSGEASSTFLLSNLIEGTYVFRVTVTDNAGAASLDEVTVTVLPLGANQPPTVDAGSDKLLFLPSTAVNLSGNASDLDGSIVSYAWTKLSGPAAGLANETTPNLSLSNLVAGQYMFRLTATDNAGASSSDDVSVTVFPGTVNQSPVANAGSNKTIVSPNTSTTLSGSGFDPDGSIVSYAWTQIAGPACTIANIDSPTLLINDLIEGSFQFQLTVQDDQGATGSDLALVTVVAVGFNLPPVADAGFDKIVNLPVNSTDIQGSGTDPDGTITSFAWTKKSGPATGTLAGQNTSKLLLSDLVAGTYQFTLTVTDNNTAANSDDVRVAVMQASINNNPTVNAGTDIFIRLPISSANLTATASDVDGTIASYLWSQVSGPAATIGPANTSSLSVSGLVQGTYVFRVEVTDNSGSIGSDDVSVVVAPPGVNQPPVVLAGSPKTISLPTNSVALNGSASDSDGSITSLNWSQQGGPSTAALSGAGTTTLGLQGLLEGIYTFRLTATDNENATAFSETTVDVKGVAIPPIVFAGNDTTLTLPNNFMPLVGEVIPGDGLITQYVWTQTEGAAVDTVGAYPQVVLNNLLAGQYTFELSVTDNNNSTASDEIVISVVESKSNPIGASIVFTPNGDAVNDVWTVKNTGMVVGCPIVIFNSLGKKIFEADEYMNDWNGMSNGQLVKEGDYYFIFECGNKKTYSGALRLIR